MGSAVFDVRYGRARDSVTFCERRERLIRVSNPQDVLGRHKYPPTECAASSLSSVCPKQRTHNETSGEDRTSYPLHVNKSCIHLTGYSHAIGVTRNNVILSLLHTPIISNTMEVYKGVGQILFRHHPPTPLRFCQGVHPLLYKSNTLLFLRTHCKVLVNKT